MFIIGDFIMPKALKPQATNTEKVLHALESQKKIPVGQVKVVQMTIEEWDKLSASYPAKPDAEWLLNKGQK